MSLTPSLTSLLLVEDDPAIGRHLEHGLSSHGYATSWCRTGSDALDHLRQSRPDVVLLDLGLPDADGTDLARIIRYEHPQVLMIIVTARDTDMDMIVGLDAGADDYLVKPFSISVLLARLRAHHRARPAVGNDESDLLIGALRLHRGSRRCWLDGKEVELRQKEFQLLAALASKVGRAVNRQDLMNEVWDDYWVGSTKTLDVTMAALRRKLADIGAGTGRDPVITTLRGYGYRLETPGPDPR